MAAPVARSLLINRHASLRFIRASLLCRSNAATVKDQSLLAPSGGGGGGGIVLGQCQFQNPSCAHLNRQVAVSAPHSLVRSSLLVGGEDRRGSGREYRLAAEGELEMRRRKEVSDDEGEQDDSGTEDGGFDSDDAGRWGDFDKADFDDDGDDGDDEDDANVDVPRRRRK